MPQFQSDSLPPFLLNTIPKSGTYLLTQILLGIPHITFSPAHHIYAGRKEQLPQHRSILENLNHNELMRGHLFHTPHMAALLQRLQMKQIFLLRDPRDIVISFVHYIHRIPKYSLYPYLMRPHLSQKERYLIVIRGIQSPQFQYPSIAEWIEQFIGWMNAPNVLTVKYEDLRQTPAQLDESLRRIANFLWKDLTPPIPLNQMVQRMKANINPASSPTFRSGKTNQWITAFDPDVKRVFKEVAGDLLISLGYEVDQSW